MKRIVVIDDHPIVLKMLVNVLNTEYELVGESSDGEEGLQMVQLLQPDLVILDLELPKLDGLSVIRGIRAKQPDTRILVLSAKPELVMANHTRMAGANSYVSKSRGVDELCGVVKAVLLGYDCFPAGSCGGGRDDMHIAVGAVHGDAGEERAAEDELGAAGDLGIEAHHGEDGPGGHFAEVVVAGDAVGRVFPDGIEHLADELLRLPGLPGEVVEPGGFDGGLVVQLGMERAGFCHRGCAFFVVEEAIETRCSSPPENWLEYLPRTSPYSRPTALSAFSTPAVACSCVRPATRVAVSNR